jgi:hypothetical protein
LQRGTQTGARRDFRAAELAGPDDTMRSCAETISPKADSLPLSSPLPPAWDCLEQPSCRLCPEPLPAATPPKTARWRAIFKELIEINTTDTPLGNVTTATTAMQKRFLDAGFAPKTCTCSVRMRAR